MDTKKLESTDIISLDAGFYESYYGKIIENDNGQHILLSCGIAGDELWATTAEISDDIYNEVTRILSDKNGIDEEKYFDVTGNGVEIGSWSGFEDVAQQAAENENIALLLDAVYEYEHSSDNRGVVTKNVKDELEYYSDGTKIPADIFDKINSSSSLSEKIKCYYEINNAHKEKTKDNIERD